MAIIEPRLAAVIGACLLAGACGDGGSNATSGTVTVTSAAATTAVATAASAPTAVVTPAPAPAVAPATTYGAVAGMPDGFNVAYYRDKNPDVVAAKMSLLGHYLQHGKAEGRLPYQGAQRAAFPTGTSTLPALVPGELWSFKTWMASEWASMGPAPFRFDHVAANGSDVVMFTDADGGPELKSYDFASGADKTSGLWEVDVTLPPMRDGLIVAPIWLYNQDGGHEIDFEFAGRKGLDVSVHVGTASVASDRLHAGEDWSGQRHRFGIKMNQAARWAEMYIDGVMVKRFDGSTGFPDKPMRPIIEMWAADPNNGGFVGWAGKWIGVAPDETLVMTVHGYRYTPLG